ncbi:hypothetical protein D6D21_06012 [Aureobasidium pullulans]|uniref:Fungal N-terminal domain-containing protein n=2 Tax=Aureobasidium pullulans TaxID=5580 RepID=A0AB74IUW5_AURPU|nr:hypothetical protein D6D21_06012 [Aureobasidium pullulans]
MVLDGGVGTATAVGSAANISLRLFQVIYEFKAVGQQTRDLLDSTKHVSSTLESARTMRQQKSGFLSTDERKWIDSIIIDTKRCLESVAALVEPARVDLQTKSGRVGFVNRSLFVFRDSPKVATNLARLNLAHQSLNAAMGVLCSKGTYWQPISELQATNQQEVISPPSYEKDQSLHRGKFSRVGSVSDMRKYHLLSDDSASLRSTYSLPQPPVFIAELESPDARFTTINCPLQQPVEMDSDTALLHVPPNNISRDSEGLQLAGHEDSKGQMDHQRQLGIYRHEQFQTQKWSADSYETCTVPTNNFQVIDDKLSGLIAHAPPMRARSRGRAWLESRGTQRL